MGLRDTLAGTISGLVLEWPLKDKDLGEVAKELDLAGGRLKHAFASAKDNPDNRRLLSHIVGIERWGQNRLHAALGEPLAMDEYDGYRPPREASWPALQDAFAETRRQTVALAQALGEAAIGDVKIPHNQFGPLSVRSWLRYLDMHANLEAKKLKS
jgi:hypothetical protein